MPATTTTTPGRSAGFDHAKLRAWREAAGLSREQVCVVVGISYPFLGLVETGVRLPRVATLVKLAEFFGHEPGELLTGSGSAR